MKETTISKTSIWSYLYMFFYRKNLPYGLCPFFWNNLVAVLFLIPYIILTLPTVLVTLLTKNNLSETKIERWVFEAGGRSFFELTLLCILFWIVTFLAGAVLIGIYNFFTPGIQGIEILGAFGLMGGFIVFLISLWEEKIKDFFKERRYQKKLKKAIAYNESLPEHLRLERKNWILDNYDDRPRDSTNWEVFKSAIKGWYDRNCPVINWVE